MNKDNSEEKPLIRLEISSKKSLIIMVSFFIFVIFSFSLIFLYSLKLSTSAPSVEALSKKYPFLSKRVLIENQNEMIINFVPLRLKLREYVEALDNKVGVYFEYLPSGISIGVKDRTEVRLASLSKVPLAMAIMKKVEEGHLSMEDKVVLTQNDLDQGFGDLWQRGAGTEMTVRELVEQSLQKSDNTAYRALFRLLTPVEVNAVYDNLEIQVSFENNSPLVSPKSYSSILRSLYLSSYLSEVNSNYLLDVLSETTFNDSISKPIPPSIPVSHKVGIFSQVDTGEIVFIDCGIVYVPRRPYILCLFVKDNETKAQEYMVTISKMVYEYVSSVRSSREN